MQTPIQITIKDDTPHSDDLEAQIHEKACKLEQFYEDIISCHVVVELTQKHKQRGKLHNVRINLAVPGKELTANKNEHENIYIAIRDAFDDMRRQLEDYAKRMNGEIKSHPELIQGKVVRIFKDDDFGFIEGLDGTEYYFNADSVVNPKFKKLEVGASVHFIKAVGSEGPQAHRVSAEKK